MPRVFAASKKISHEGQGLTAVEKIFNKNAVGTTPGKVLHAGSDVRVEVNIVGSRTLLGLMTSQELESMAATVISPILMVLISRVAIPLQYGILVLSKYSKTNEVYE
ncbi:MAG: hypothetical protein CM15mP23_22500 [Cryomorphaceae bacterium]|nr:MAG: hypothetical protein CM15mP23_22500 [Cryomorphaceae bacterium]